ncbi:MAG: hypothetical protein QQN41_06025 [Nitrosopumilus sp.]
MTEQTFEELTASVKTLTDELTSLKVLVAKKGQDDNNDHDEMEAFLKAKAEMDDEEKEATEDDEKREAVRKAFKVATDETDEDKKHEAMKKAQEMKDEDDARKAKKAKKGQDEEEDPTHTVEATKLANLERKYAKPIITKILNAAKNFEPNNYKQIEKKLRTASLPEVEEIWESKKPYIAALGLENSNESTPTMGMIPFQASSITGEPEETDFAKMDSEKLLSEMYR